MAVKCNICGNRVEEVGNDPMSTLAICYNCRMNGGSTHYVGLINKLTAENERYKSAIKGLPEYIWGQYVNENTLVTSTNPVYEYLEGFLKEVEIYFNGTMKGDDNEVTRHLICLQEENNQEQE